MSCGWNRCAFFIGKMIFVAERLACCCALVAIISCIVAFFMFIISVGVGIGYNYCYYNQRIQELERIREANKKNSTKPVTSESIETVSLEEEEVTKSIVERDSDDKNVTFRATMKSARADEAENYTEMTTLPTTEENVQLRIHRNILLEHPHTLGVPTVTSPVNISRYLSKMLSNQENVTVQLLAN